MRLFKGELFGSPHRIDYANRHIDISITRDDGRVYSFDLFSYEARKYQAFTLSHLSSAISSTLSEMKSDLVIKIGVVEISHNGAENLDELIPMYAIEVNRELLRKYSDYIIKPSLLVSGTLADDRLSVNLLTKYDGVIIDGNKYIIEDMYVIPNSSNNIVKFYFNDTMQLVSKRELLKASKLARDGGDSKEENHKDVIMFS